MTDNANIHSTPLRKLGAAPAMEKLELRFQGLTIHELVGKYLPLMQKELKEAGLPEDLSFQ